MIRTGYPIIYRNYDASFALPTPHYSLPNKVLYYDREHFIEGQLGMLRSAAWNSNSWNIF